MGEARFNPGFERNGGGTPTLKTILDGLNSARGTAYDTVEDGVVYAENEAIARMLWCAWEQNQRFANQFDPDRMTDFLPRWEAIFGLTPLDSDTDTERRRAVKERMLRIGVVPTRQELIDRLTVALGSAFVSYTNIELADSTQWVPNTSPAWPAGPPPAVRNVTTLSYDPTWYSTTAHILILVTRPSAMNIGQFWEALGRVYPILDAMVPAWVTWEFYVESPTGAGFFLDEENNLDHYIFD